ncbi:MAG: pyruvate synthase subunit beta, partial [Candidatus Woesearchaeota archaeon]
SYVATANVDNPIDINNKIKKALNSDGVSYVQIFSPCPLGWKHESSKTIEIAKLAVETRFYPIFEIENGILKLKNVENSKDVKTFLAMQGRFKHVNNNEIDEIRRYINEQWNRLLELDKSKAKL